MLGIKIYPKNHPDHYVELTRDSFHVFWSALGFEPEHNGELWSQIIRNAIKCFDPELVLQCIEGSSREEAAASVDTCLKNFIEICDVAEREETKIIWEIQE